MDKRRKRLLYQCTHCGMKENDVLLGGFARALIGDLNEGELEHLEALIGVPDNDLLNWILGKTAPDPAHDTALLKRIQDFNKGP